MPISPLWAVLFFAMLITLGLSSQYGILEGVITPIYESKLVPIRKEILSGTLPYQYAIIILLKCEGSDSEHHFMLYVQLKVCYVLMNGDQCFWCFFFFSGCLCVAAFLVGLLFCQKSGEYWLQTFDSFSGPLPLLVVGFFELVGVSYVYGLKRFDIILHMHCIQSLLVP